MDMIITGVGWIGIGFVLISFVITGEKNLRFLNVFGCFFQVLFFILSKGVVKNIPIFTLNIVLILVNVYHLWIKKWLKKH